MYLFGATDLATVCSVSRDHGQDADQRLSPDECIELAKSYVDLLFDPAKSWYRKMTLMGMEIFLRNPGAYETIQSRLLELHPYLGNFRTLTVEEQTNFRLALQRKQRSKVYELLTASFARNPPTQQVANFILATAKPLPMRKALLAAADEFKGKPGRPSEVTAVRSELASFAEEQLAPLILNVLQAQERGTRYSLREYLEIARRDFPKASAFLLRHLASFEKALADPTLLARGKQSSTRAQVLADAMAGADYGLKFSTSLKRVGEGRMVSKRL